MSDGLCVVCAALGITGERCLCGGLVRELPHKLTGADDPLSGSGESRAYYAYREVARRLMVAEREHAAAVEVATAKLHLVQAEWREALAAMNRTLLEE